MKLAILIQHYFPYGGLQRDALRLASAACAAGHQATVIASTWDGPMPTTPDEFSVKLLASGGTSNHTRAARFAADCQKLLPKYDTAICFSRVPGCQFHFCGDPCLKEKIIRNKPAVVRLLPRYRYLLENEASIFSTAGKTHVFFLAKSEIQPYQTHYTIGRDHYTVLPPWLKKPIPPAGGRAAMRAKLCAELSISEEDPILLFVGSDFKRKGLDLAIEAMNLCQTQQLRLIVCGQDDPTSFKKTAEALSAEVHFLGPRDDIADWMASADLLIHPARQETAGMVLVEALTHGLPVLCTENCGYAEHVAAAGCPTLPSDPASKKIAQHIDQMLTQRVELSASATNWAKQPNRYNTADIMLNLMQESLAV